MTKINIELDDDDVREAYEWARRSSEHQENLLKHMRTLISINEQILDTLNEKNKMERCGW